MIKVNYTELDGPAGPTCRLEASGHAGYAPAGQDIVCAGASTLMQTLCALLAGEEGTKSGVWDEPDGPRLAVTAAAPQKPWVEGAFEFAKAGFALLAERYPDNVRFADLSGRGEQSMVDLQLFASEGGDAAAPSAPALSHAQAQQAIASYNKIVVFIDRSPAECYNKFRMLWIGGTSPTAKTVFGRLQPQLLC